MSLCHLQRQANFLPKDASKLDKSRRFTLPPDPSNTRIQGAYTDIWEISSHSSRPGRFTGRSQSSLDFRTPGLVSAESSATFTESTAAATALNIHKVLIPNLVPEL